MIEDRFAGTFPDTAAQLRELPGVGVNTAGALQAYAFNTPALFVETNIRTVYLHHFFADQTDVDDRAILDLLDKTLDRQNPRQFYWALMDYGSWLKSNGVKNIGRSRHYVKQSPLKGSVREVRGRIITLLTKQARTELELLDTLDADSRFEPALRGLQKDGLIEEANGYWRLTQ
jgi:A/G-specific adenine glycosylase